MPSSGVDKNSNNLEAIMLQINILCKIRSCTCLKMAFTLNLLNKSAYFYCKNNTGIETDSVWELGLRGDGLGVISWNFSDCCTSSGGTSNKENTKAQDNK